MTRKSLGVLATISLALLLGTGSVFAQGLRKITADIPYAFSFGGKELPAGSYKFYLAADRKTVTVADAKNDKTLATALVVTSIAPSSATFQANVVLDVADQGYILSEVWIPGRDGVLISGYRTDIEHKHRTIKAKEP